MTVAAKLLRLAAVSLEVLLYPSSIHKIVACTDAASHPHTAQGKSTPGAAAGGQLLAVDWGAA